MLPFVRFWGSKLECGGNSRSPWKPTRRPSPDISGRIFPNRALPVLLLAAGALLNAIVAAISIGIAALLMRIVNTH